MDTKGIELFNLNAGLIANVRLSQKSGPVIKPVEAVKKSNQNGTALDAGKQEVQKNISWLPMAAGEEDARLATEILAENLEDSENLEVGWHYDKENRVFIVEVKDRNTGEVIRQMPPENILNSRNVFDSDGSGSLINQVA